MCRSCFEPVKREGFLSRLRRVFSGAGGAGAGKPPSSTVFKTNIQVTRRIKIRDPLTGELREYHSLDEVPEEFREKIRQAFAAVASGKSANAITVTDSAGKVQTYHSTEEMPPDVRALYEKARGEGSSS